jgi:hypothetical protein
MEIREKKSIAKGINAGRNKCRERRKLKFLSADGERKKNAEKKR